VRGDVNTGSYTEFVGSAPVPTLNTGGSLRFPMPTTITGTQHHSLLLSIPPAGLPDQQQLYSIRFATGAVNLARLRYRTGGSLQLLLFDSDDVLIGDAGVVGFGIDGQRFYLQISLTNNGANLDTAVKTWEFTGLDVAPVLEQNLDTFAGLNVGRAERSAIGSGGALAGVAVGHLAVSPVTQIVVGLEQALTGFFGETAGRRIERLFRQRGIPVVLVGNPDATERMGPQGSGTPLQLIRAAEQADHGILYQPREAAAVAYRTRESMYNQTTAATIDFAVANQVAPPWAPQADDLPIANDVTVTRTGGASARAIQETGPLNVGDPAADPQAAGAYMTELELNLETDSQPPLHAGWLRWLGTQDLHRFPAITVDLVREKLYGGGQTIIQALAGLDPGDLLAVTSPPDDLPPDTIEQIVLGTAETLSEVTWQIGVHGAPGTPYRVGQLDDTVLGRLDTDGSQLAAPFIIGVATTMSVAVTDGPLWTVDAAEFPFDIRVAGWVLQVSGITGTASPQTFTVTPVTGPDEPMALAAGEPVELAHPMVLAL
jgi:hypothetical protein